MKREYCNTHTNMAHETLCERYNTNHKELLVRDTVLFRGKDYGLIVKNSVLLKMILESDWEFEFVKKRIEWQVERGKESIWVPKYDLYHIFRFLEMQKGYETKARLSVLEWKEERRRTVVNNWERIVTKLMSTSFLFLCLASLVGLE